MVTLPVALEVRRARFRRTTCGCCTAEFGGVFAGDDALVGSMNAVSSVEQGGLAGAGAAGDQNVGAASADDQGSGFSRPAARSSRT